MKDYKISLEEAVEAFMDNCPHKSRQGYCGPLNNYRNLVKCSINCMYVQLFKNKLLHEEK